MASPAGSGDWELVGWGSKMRRRIAKESRGEKLDFMVLGDADEVDERCCDFGVDSRFSWFLGKICVRMRRDAV